MNTDVAMIKVIGSRQVGRGGGGTWRKVGGGGGGTLSTIKKGVGRGH